MANRNQRHCDTPADREDWRKWVARVLFCCPFGLCVFGAQVPVAHSHQIAHHSSLGEPGDPAKASRTVRVEMSDQMRFSPEEIQVRQGETIRFLLINAGTVKHEMVLGRRQELEAHAALMRKFPMMEHDHANQASVGPNASGEIVWHFTAGGTFDFACLQPGHFEAGMRGKIIVDRAGFAGEARSHTVESHSVKGHQPKTTGE